MPTTWTIAIDWDRNDNYSGTYDDVTNRVISAKWFLGMRQAYKEDPDNSTLELILSNTDKLLSPENSSSPLWDGIHPSAPGLAPDDYGAAADLSPENLTYGYTVRNLTALQALDAVWRGAMY